MLKSRLRLERQSDESPLSRRGKAAGGFALDQRVHFIHFGCAFSREFSPAAHSNR